MIGTALAFMIYVKVEEVKSLKEIEMLNTKEEVDATSIAFGELVQGYVGDAKYALILRANAAEQNPNICHSHDFCDANVFMAQAIQTTLGNAGVQLSEDEVFDFIQTDKGSALFNDSWSKWKADNCPVTKGKTHEA